MKSSMVCAGFMVVLSLPAVAAEPARPAISDLKWLTGCWAATNAEAGSLEVWMPPAGGTMLGMSRTIKNGKTAAWEFVQLRQQDDGTIEYIAKPHNQEKASFRLIASEGRSVTFENPAHDFPQRVIYKLGDDGLLQARIEGTMNGALKGVDFPMKKAACE